jgi:hypothetical protein
VAGRELSLLPSGRDRAPAIRHAPPGWHSPPAFSPSTMALTVMAKRLTPTMGKVVPLKMALLLCSSWLFLLLGMERQRDLVVALPFKAHA